MTPIQGPRALLEVTFVLGSQSTRAHATWSYKVLSGATVRRRRRYVRLPVGVDNLRHVSDSEQILALLDSMANEIAEADLPKAPAPPGGGAMGEEFLIFDD